ncbi:hypothetical protein Hanom_Chr10g00954261 [Helianthus anomalus]
MHEEREIFGGGGAKVVRELQKDEVGMSFSAPVGVPDKWDKGGGPTAGESSFDFILGSGVLLSSKAQRKSRLGLRGMKARSCSSNDVSPGSQRPKKRSRPDSIDPQPRFCFIGFTTKNREGDMPGSSASEGQAGVLDLNARASSEDPSAGVVEGDSVPGGVGASQLESI